MEAAVIEVAEAEAAAVVCVLSVSGMLFDCPPLPSELMRNAKALYFLLKKLRKSFSLTSCFS